MVVSALISAALQAVPLRPKWIEAQAITLDEYRFQTVHSSTKRKKPEFIARMKAEDNVLVIDSVICEAL